MNTAVRDACAFGAELSRYAVTTPPSARATEQSAVEVSIRMILSIGLFYKSQHVLDIWEYLEGNLLQVGVEN